MGKMCCYLFISLDVVNRCRHCEKFGWFSIGDEIWNPFTFPDVNECLYDSSFLSSVVVISCRFRLLNLSVHGTPRHDKSNIVFNNFFSFKVRQHRSMGG